VCSSDLNIVLDKKEHVLAVNESVLQFDKDNKTFVEVEIAPQQYEKRYIETGISDSINIEVISGIDKDIKLTVPKV
jgi:HlyD family secretion protein